MATGAAMLVVVVYIHARATRAARTLIGPTAGVLDAGSRGAHRSPTAHRPARATILRIIQEIDTISAAFRLSFGARLTRAPCAIGTQITSCAANPAIVAIRGCIHTHAVAFCLTHGAANASTRLTLGASHTNRSASAAMSRISLGINALSRTRGDSSSNRNYVAITTEVAVPGHIAIAKIDGIGVTAQTLSSITRTSDGKHENQTQAQAKSGPSGK